MEAESLFKAYGAMTPAARTLHRLPRLMQGRYGDQAEVAMTRLQEEETLPDGTASIAVPLDGVMVRQPGKTQYKEAACGTVSCLDQEGNHLKTLYFGQMPEPGKMTLKASIFREVTRIREHHPDIPLVAVADRAADNWTFLESLSPEVGVINIHACCEHLSRISYFALAPNRYDTYRRYFVINRRFG